MNIPAYRRGFAPYALGALVIGLVGGFSTLLGPAFVGELGIGYENTTWTALAQAIPTAACAPILGRLGDRLGRGRTLKLGLAAFTLGNVLTALAHSLAFLLGARFLVGLGTAAMAPVILGYILAEYPRDRVGRGFAEYMLLSSGAVVVGPTLGGAILAGPGWRAMSWVCAGLSAGAWGMGALLLRRDRAVLKKSAPFDGAGAVWVILFFSLALCLPALGQCVGTGAFLLALAGCVLSGVCLYFTEKGRENPILSGEILKKRAFILSVTALFLTQGLLQANMTSAQVFLRYAHPERTLSAGVTVSVLYLGMALGAAVLGPMGDRHSPRRVLGVCLALAALSCGGLLGVGPASGQGALMLPLGLLGLGLGGGATLLMKVALAGLEPGQANAASGTFGLFRDLAAPFGVAVLVPLFNGRVDAGLAQGLPDALAATQALHTLARVELISLAAAGVAVWGMK